MVGSRASLRQARCSAPVATVLALLLLPSPPAAADRRDQRAADLYTEGVKLIRKGKYREGAAKVNEALRRGATEPVEAQGSESRFQARPYDPYYWLGVAQMETGLPEQALANFEKSSTMVPKGRTRPVLADAPAEWADLARRKALLLASLETPTPVAVAASTPPPPTPTPFAVRLPERPTVPAPTAAPAVASLATPTAPPPAARPVPPSALALRDDLSALLALPEVAARAGAALRSRGDRLAAALARGAGAAGAAEREIRRELSGEEGRPVLRAALAAGLEAHRERRYEDAGRLARIAGRLAPSAPQPALLRAASLGTLWVLEGETRAALGEEAREALAAWRSLRPAGSAPSRFLSPALRERLEKAEPRPSRG